VASHSNIGSDSPAICLPVHHPQARRPAAGSNAVSKRMCQCIYVLMYSTTHVRADVSDNID